MTYYSISFATCKYLDNAIVPSTIFSHSHIRKPPVLPCRIRQFTYSVISGKGGSNRLDDTATTRQNLYRLLRYRVRSPQQFSRYVPPLFGWCGYEFFRLCQVSSPKCARYTFKNSGKIPKKALALLY